MAGILTLKQLSLNPEPPVPNTAGAAGLTQQALATYKVASVGVRLGQPDVAASGLNEIVVADLILSNALCYRACSVAQTTHLPEPVEPDGKLPDVQNEEYGAGEKECCAKYVPELFHHVSPCVGFPRCHFSI